MSSQNDGLDAVVEMAKARAQRRPTLADDRRGPAQRRVRLSGPRQSRRHAPHLPPRRGQHPHDGRCPLASWGVRFPRDASDAPEGSGPARDAGAVWAASYRRLVDVVLRVLVPFQLRAVPGGLGGGWAIFVVHIRYLRMALCMMRRRLRCR